MSVTLQDMQNALSTLGMTLESSPEIRQLAEKVRAEGGTAVPGTGESVRELFSRLGLDSLLPELPAPSASLSAGGGLSMAGLSLETLLDAVGFEQRRAETKAGTASLKAHAQERAEANAEKLKNVQEQLEKSKSRGFLDGLLKAFKYIGMALAAIGAVALMATGGGAAIAVGVISMVLLASSITEEATGGKVGFSPAFITGKIMEAAGASETAIMWTKFAVDIATSIALAVGGGLAAAGKIGGSAAKAGADAASTAAKTASTTADAAAKAAQAADKLKHVASIVARVSTGLGGANTIAQSATSIASAVNEKDISFLQAQQKRLEAILEKIAMANELDIEHIKQMMQRSEQTLQTVSDIVQECAQTNTAVLAGNPAMA
ncbi:MAG TPA: type III secretion system translocon subunit SctE [Candidatus Mailhella excrementigallinarum]|nr:type III secretion system translocon subunit SctE [Candidatus Mailhella excrementigallinarum]